jgi:hypothetical protein
MGIDIERRIKELESLLPEPEEVYEVKYAEKFEKYATYMGNGVYQWRGLYAPDTRMLWLLGVLRLENIEIKDEDE